MIGPSSQESRSVELVVTKSWLVWSLVVFSALLGFMFWMLFQWGVFGSAPESQDGTKLVAAVLALLGTVLTGALTFMGLFTPPGATGAY